MYECRIAEKLVELRAAKGVTQGDVAKHLAVSNKTVSKWENGISMPDLPMLVGLSQYFGITADALLGLTEGQERAPSTEEEIATLFRGLDRRKSVLKAFETVRALVPAMYERSSKYHDDASDKESVVPSGASYGCRSSISLHEFFEFAASSKDVNVAVMLLRNEANFAWMKDADKQKEIVKIFRFLSSEDVLSVLYFVHSTNCSESFTADYVASNTGLSEERVAQILDTFCSVGACHWLTAHLAEGEVRVYESRGDGILLSLITLAFEIMCGKKSYDYCFNGRCKMIGGK